MGFQEFLQGLKGDMPQEELARCMAMSQAQISRLLSGKTNPTIGAFRGLMMGFPERRAEIIAFFLSSDSVSAEEANRFWAHVDKTGDCWNWLKSRNHKGKGYGYFSSKTRGMVGAHRFSWELAHGSIPEGLEVCHKCDNPGCVRPEHLYLGTHDQNMHDAWSRRFHPGESFYALTLRLSLRGRQNLDDLTTWWGESQANAVERALQLAWMRESQRQEVKVECPPMGGSGTDQE